MAVVKYNPPNGGPAWTPTSLKVVEDRANALLADGLQGVKRISLMRQWPGHVKAVEFLVQPFVEGLAGYRWIWRRFRKPV